MESLLREFNLTTEQEAAIDIDRSIALSAGAGSGKTRVLTTRYIYLLANGVDIDNIVALTFTEKAALEMKERVMEAIFQRVKYDRRNRELWQASLDKLSSANISTIHSFCAGILRENAPYIGMDYNFAIVDELERRSAINDIWDNILSRYLEDPGYKEFMDYMSQSIGKLYSEDMLRRDILAARESILESGRTLDEFNGGHYRIPGATYAIDLMLELDSHYSRYKLERGLLDYGDLQTLCLQVLSIKDINAIYRQRYRYLMIDEFQDTNQIQKKIIYSLIEEGGTVPPGSLFVVGDFKQSIYGFRGTDYRIFGEVQSQLGDENCRSLKTCFRSEHELIYGINSIFQTLIDSYEPMVPHGDREGQVDVERRIKLIKYQGDSKKSGKKASIDELKSYIKSKESGKIDEFHNILSNLKDDISTIEPMESKNMGETVLKSIDLLLGQGLEYRDICILVRSRSLNSEIEEKLLEEDIPYNIIGGTSLYESREIKNVMAIYELIADTENENTFNYLKLLQVLKGDFFNLPDDILLFIYKNQIERDMPCFWDAMEYSIDILRPGYNREKLCHAYSTLEFLHSRCEELNAIELLEEIVDRCQVIDRLLCQDNGLQKVRNIEKLLDLLEGLDRERLFNHSGLIEHLKVLSQYGSEEQGIIEALDSQAVNIMTIHQSKGLEFKGVIIPGMERDLLYMSHRENSNRGFLYDGANLLFREESEGEDEFSEYIEGQIREEIAENIRLLYVAMTRAEEYVVLVGREDNKKGDILKSFLDMVEYAIVQNEDVGRWMEIEGNIKGNML